MYTRWPFWTTLILLAALARPRDAAAQNVGRAFETALRSPITVVWENVPVRQALERLSASTEVAVLLDRRIDPSLPLTGTFTGVRLQAVLGGVATHVGARMSVVGNAVYLGPEAQSRIVRTLAELRAAEVRSLPPTRRAELRRKTTVQWADLDRPDEILGRICKTYDLTITEEDRVPLDMWAAGTMPGMTAAEQLTLVLVQFDLTCAWHEDGSGIELLPVPDDVELERSYPVPAGKAVRLAQSWRRAIPGIRAEPRGGQVVVRGLSEQLERIEALRKPSTSRPKSRRRPNASQQEGGGDAKRVFSGVVNGKLNAVLANLGERTGFQFVIDEESLAAAGVAVDQVVRAEADDDTLSDLLRKLLAPYGLTFIREGPEIRVFAPPGR